MGKHAAYSVAWKYLILVLAMKALNRTGPRLKTGSAKAIYDYLRDHHQGGQSNPIALLISYMKRIEGVKVGQYEAGAKTRELASLYKLEELEPLLPALRGLCERQPVAVFIDELDRGWDATEDAQGFVSGLVQASIYLNDRVQGLTVFVSLAPRAL